MSNKLTIISNKNNIYLFHKSAFKNRLYSENLLSNFQNYEI